ncbi:rhodanese-like domain-containing protein [Chloroflexota bacterium]
MKKVLLTILTLGLLFGLTVTSSVPLAAASETNPQVQTLYAGQDIDIGTVSVWDDADNLYVKYSTTGGWELLETHLAVATSPGDIPQTKKGNPIPGQFSEGESFDIPVTDVTYTIPLPDAWYTSRYTTLYIAAHAAVSESESAWAAGIQFDGKNWATYFIYNQFISVEDACALIQANEGNDDFVILDVRTDNEFFLGHLEGAVNLDYRAPPYSSGNAVGFTAAVDQLDKDDTYLVYCRSGARGWYAMKIMKALGFTDVHNIEGGYLAWTGASGLECTSGEFAGTWLLSVNDGTYMHDMFVLDLTTTGSPVSSSYTGHITGIGGYPAGSGPTYPYPYNWALEGTIIASDISMTIYYENSYVATFTGAIDPDLNFMSGGAGTGGVINWEATRVP